VQGESDQRICTWNRGINRLQCYKIAAKFKLRFWTESQVRFLVAVTTEISKS